MKGFGSWVWAMIPGIVLTAVVFAVAKHVMANYAPTADYADAF